MGLREQQDLLARLYADPRFREEFLVDPQAIGRQHRLEESEVGDLVAIIPEDLRFFGDSLVEKRLQEARKLLPLLARVLANDFRPQFVAFASGYNPQSIKKHLEDAIEFCRFIELPESCPDTSRIAARFERTGLDFFDTDKRIAFCRLNREVLRFISQERSGRRRPVFFLAVWARLNRRVRRFLI